MQVKLQRIKHEFYDFRLSAEGVYSTDLLAYAQSKLGAVRYWHVSKDNLRITNAKDKRAVIRVKIG